MKQAAIIGATSSLAVELARQLAVRQVDLLLVGRDSEELQRLKTDLAIRAPVAVQALPFTLGVVTDEEALLAKLESMDVIFFCIGDMGNENALSADNIRAVTEHNYTQIAVLLAAIVERLKQQDAVIAVISSVAGDRGRASNFVYGAAKAALTTFASGLRASLHQAGSPLHILTIKPGMLDTPLTWAMSSRLIAPRDVVASDIIRAANKRQNTLYTPRIWWFIMTIIKLLPEPLFKRMKR